MSATFFESPLHFRTWLQASHASATELVVGYRKVGTGLPSMTWSESVDEALCFGWIDGVRKSIDEQAYQIRFTPRKKGSIWSLINVAKVQVLIAQGRMHPAGIAAYEARSPEKTGIYAFERKEPAQLTPAEVKKFRSNRDAWAYFESAPPGYRRVIVHWVVSAKQDATRARRLQQLMQACAEGRSLR
jgi:uncharacterized protein YdeI (YjbR/CyaY-like superfamily)